jgi:hypothetical protein
MRPRTFGLAVAALSIAVAAVPAAALGEGADVSKGDTCTLQLSQFPGSTYPDVVTEQSHSVQTNSKNHNSNANCHGQLPAGTEPSRAVKFKDIGCFTATSGPGTADLVITPSGRVNFTCHFKS